MRARFRLLLTFLLVLSASGCKRAEQSSIVTAPESPEVVAMVAGVAITRGELAAELKRRFGSGSADVKLSAGQKLEVLEALVGQQALYAKAMAAGFDRTAEIQARIKNLIVSQYLEHQSARLQPPEIAPREIEEYYHANLARYAVPAAVRGAEIFLRAIPNATPEKAAERRAHAEQILREASAAADEKSFAALVARHSEDQARRYRGGELGWLSRGDTGVEPVVLEALLAMPTAGEIAPLVTSPRGFHIVKLIETRAAGHQPLADVREEIRYLLSRERAQAAELDFYAAMKAGLEIKINREAIESVSLPAENEAAPPRMPGATAQNTTR